VENRRTFRHLVDGIDEHHTLLAKPLDHRTVVNDLVISVNGRAIQFRGAVEAVDGHDNAGAESAGCGEDHVHMQVLSRTGLAATRRLCGAERARRKSAPLRKACTSRLTSFILPTARCPTNRSPRKRTTPPNRVALSRVAIAQAII